PLGIFDSTSATTELRPIRDFKPPIRLTLDYFTDEHNHPRGVAKMPGPGPTWITACVSLPDKDAKERLVASYLKIRGQLEAYEKGLCVWNDKKESFEKLRPVWTKEKADENRAKIPEGH